jgi:hypothetical protein
MDGPVIPDFMGQLGDHVSRPTGPRPGVPRAGLTWAWPWRAHLSSLSLDSSCQQQQHPSPSTWSCIGEGSCSMR